MGTDVFVEVNGEPLRLLPERAIYWERTDTVFIADLHLGKATTFLARGVPLPNGHTAADLQRLSDVLDRTNAEKLIILGDLVHAKQGYTPRLTETVARWRERQAVNVTLVRGNHDRHAGDPPLEWKIRCIDGPTPGPNFVLQHEPFPPRNPNAYVLSGHLHPGVRLQGRGKQSLKVACYWFGERVGVLPAFGSFTGTAGIYAAQTDRVFAVTASAVIRVQ